VGFLRTSPQGRSGPHTGLQHSKHSGHACCLLPAHALPTSLRLGHLCHQVFLSGLLVDIASTLLLCSPPCKSTSCKFTLQGPLPCVYRYGILVQLPMLCPGQAWRSSYCVLWCMSLGPTLPLRPMSWGPAVSCKAFSGEPANAGRSSSSSRYTLCLKCA